jgi:uncharacterized membrane protein YGL010W
MKGIQSWLDEYGVSHQNPTNKAIHWICVPLIMFSIIGLFMIIPFPTILNGWINVASIFLILALLFYLRLSIPMFLGFFIIGGGMLLGNKALLEANLLSFSNVAQGHLVLMLIVFLGAWIGQFIGHKIEGVKPSFFKDLQFLLIGPAWLLHFIFKKLGISY